jgi:NADPH2:quinone reductase
MTSNREQQMNAVVMQASGPPAQALTVRSEPVPEPGPGEVLVEVHAAGVNPFDVVIGGAGLVGQAATAIAHWRGAKPIVADVRKPEGVEDFIDTSSHDLSKAVLELTGERGADMVLDTIGGALFEPAVNSLRSGGRLTGLHSHERVEFNPSEIYDHDRHVTGLASVFIDGADGAKIFDQLASLFDRGLLTPPATKTWPLQNSAEAYQRVLDGAHGIKQVLLPIGEA